MISRYEGRIHAGNSNGSGCLYYCHRTYVEARESLAKRRSIGGQARAALLALGLTALVVLLAIMLPQNPAP
jgi:hypothetical protein